MYIDEVPYLGKEATALQMQTVLEVLRSNGMQVGSEKRGISKNGVVKVCKQPIPILDFYNTCASVVVELCGWDKVGPCLNWA